uniref:hypothetical protein n=1 Tax=Phenylobacterium sp. TaxID=1871053 RepID=UPI0037CB8DC0
MTILVTGGTKGIGLAIAEYVARPDEQLVLGVWSRSVGESAKLILHSGRTYGPDTPWQRHDHVRRSSGDTAIE